MFALNDITNNAYYRRILGSLVYIVYESNCNLEVIPEYLQAANHYFMVASLHQVLNRQTIIMSPNFLFTTPILGILSMNALGLNAESIKVSLVSHTIMDLVSVLSDCKE
jgi:hypothetical protein